MNLLLAIIFPYIISTHYWKMQTVTCTQFSLFRIISFSFQISRVHYIALLVTSNARTILIHWQIRFTVLQELNMKYKWMWKCLIRSKFARSLFQFPEKCEIKKNHTRKLYSIAFRRIRRSRPLRELNTHVFQLVWPWIMPCDLWRSSFGTVCSRMRNVKIYHFWCNHMNVISDFELATIFIQFDCVKLCNERKNSQKAWKKITSHEYIFDCISENLKRAWWAFSLSFLTNPINSHRHLTCWCFMAFV